jgi:hypothetical protein
MIDLLCRIVCLNEKCRVKTEVIEKKNAYGRRQFQPRQN